MKLISEYAETKLDYLVEKDEKTGKKNFGYIYLYYLNIPNNFADFMESLRPQRE